MNTFFTFDRLLTTLSFLAIALAAFLMPAQNDTWWQMRAGQEMWQTRHVLLHDTFSHTVYGAYWPNHEWLSQVLFYGLYTVGGLPLLTIVSATAVIAAWLLVWRLTPGTMFQVHADRARDCSASTLWGPCPQVLSLFLLALTITLLTSRRYIWLPVVFLLWANLHAPGDGRCCSARRSSPRSWSTQGRAGSRHRTVCSAGDVGDFGLTF